MTNGRRGKGRRKAFKLGVMTCRSPTHNPRPSPPCHYRVPVRFLETRSRIKRTKPCSARARQTDWELSFQSRAFQSSNNATNIPTQTQGLRDRNMQFVFPVLHSESLHIHNCDKSYVPHHPTACLIDKAHDKLPPRRVVVSNNPTYKLRVVPVCQRIEIITRNPCQRCFSTQRRLY